MAERQFPSNTDEARMAATTPPQPAQQQPKNVSAAVSGARTVDKTPLDKASEFLGFNKPKTFGDWVAVVADMTNRVYSAFDTLTGNKRGPGTINAQVPAARIAYSQIYQNQNNQQFAQPRQTSTYSYDNIAYRTRGDAEVVLAQMRELLDIYKNVSVNDLFDLSGITSPNGYTDNKFGWRDLSMARVVQAGSDFMILLPKAVQL